MLTALVLFAACAPDSSDVVLGDAAVCGDGFGRGDDGNCYPLEDPDAFTNGTAWAESTALCEGDADNTVTFPNVGGTVVSVWGDLTPEMLALCEVGFDSDLCKQYDRTGATRAVVASYGMSGDSVVALCVRFDLTDSRDGAVYAGFELSPLTAYFLVD